MLSKELIRAARARCAPTPWQAKPGLPGTQVRDCRQDAGATETRYPLILAGREGSCRVVLELNLRRVQERVVDKATTHGILDAGAMLVIQL